MRKFESLMQISSMVESFFWLVQSVLSCNYWSYKCQTFFTNTRVSM